VLTKPARRTHSAPLLAGVMFKEVPLEEIFTIIIDGVLKSAKATIVRIPEVVLKVNISVYDGDDIDFKSAIYTNPSFSTYVELEELTDAELLLKAINIFKAKFKFRYKYLNEIRVSGLRAMINWPG
jgi:hypothetical protein